jgi:hypothetical protein
MMNPHEIDFRKFPFTAAFCLGFSDGFLGLPPANQLTYAPVPVNLAWYRLGYTHGTEEEFTWLERRPFLAAFAGDTLDG